MKAGEERPKGKIHGGHPLRTALRPHPLVVTTVPGGGERCKEEGGAFAAVALSRFFPMHLPKFLGALCLGGVLSFPAPQARAADNNDWKEISRTPTLTIYARDHTGSSVKEVKAVGTFDEPNWVVKNVLDDADHYSQFMPHVVESKVVSRDRTKGQVVAYARVDPPMISERDYTILVQDESRSTPAGPVYKTHWSPANDKGPAEKSGVVRIKNNEGSWVLEPTDNGQHTQGTYILWTDAGGGVPAFILNSLNKKRLTELFETVEKRSQDDQYHKTKPALP